MSGFTLIELLVAAGITTLLAGLMVTIVVNVTGFWTRASGRLACEARARHILDQLTLDLSSALLRDDGNVWFAADIVNDAVGGEGAALDSGEFHAQPAGAASSKRGSPSIAEARFGPGAVWLRFFSMKRGDNAGLSTISAPVAVSYRITRRWGGQGPSYSFHRVEALPGRSAEGSDGRRGGGIESGYDITAAAYPTESDHEDLSTIVADHVIDFGVRCYVPDRTRVGGLRLIFPLDGSAPLRARRPAPAHATVADEADGAFFPRVVEIMLRILTDEGARLVGALERADGSSNTGDHWWQAAVAHSHVFTRRVILNTDPP